MKQTKLSIINLYGINHEVLNATEFDYHSANKLDETKQRHPLGTIYEKDGYGYVANGHEWFKFPMNKLQEINNHPDAGV